MENSRLYTIHNIVIRPPLKTYFGIRMIFDMLPHSGKTYYVVSKFEISNVNGITS